VLKFLLQNPEFPSITRATIQASRFRWLFARFVCSLGWDECPGLPASEMGMLKAKNEIGKEGVGNERNNGQRGSAAANVP
jgi:hypothetical protein